MCRVKICGDMQTHLQRLHGKMKKMRRAKNTRAGSLPLRTAELTAVETGVCGVSVNPVSEANVTRAAMARATDIGSFINTTYL